MNKKGFTLIEIIACIAILILIGLVATVSYNAISNKTKTQQFERITDEIEAAAEVYFDAYPENEYRKKLETTKKAVLFPISVLIELDLIKEDIVNPVTNKVLELDSKVKAYMENKDDEIKYLYPGDIMLIVPTDLALNEEDDTGVSNKDGITNKNIVRVKGNGTKNGEVEIYINGETTGIKGDVDSKGKFEVEIFLNDGENKINAISVSEEESSEMSEEIKVILDNQAPVLDFNELIIKIDKDYDLKTGVSATDNLDGDMISKIKISKDIDNTKEGNYEIDYSVEDTAGNKVTKTRVVRVKGLSYPEYEITFKTGTMVERVYTTKYVYNNRVYVPDSYQLEKSVIRLKIIFDDVAEQKEYSLDNGVTWLEYVDATELSYVAQNSGAIGVMARASYNGKVKISKHHIKAGTFTIADCSGTPATLTGNYRNCDCDYVSLMSSSSAGINRTLISELCSMSSKTLTDSKTCKDTAQKDCKTGRVESYYTCSTFFPMYITDYSQPLYIGIVSLRESGNPTCTSWSGYGLCWGDNPRPYSVSRTCTQKYAATAYYYSHRCTYQKLGICSTDTREFETIYLD